MVTFCRSADDLTLLYFTRTRSMCLKKDMNYMKPVAKIYYLLLIPWNNYLKKYLIVFYPIEMKKKDCFCLLSTNVWIIYSKEVK